MTGVVAPATAVPAASTTAVGADSAGRSLDRALVRSIAWNGAAKWTTQAATWLSTIAVARILDPTDYGLVGMATIFTGFVAMLSEFGLGSAVVTLRDLDRRQIAQINGLCLVIGIIAFGIALLAAEPLGRFFLPEVTPVVVVLAATFVIGALRVVPHALLQRDLRFRLLSVIEATQAIFLATATLVLAWLGFGYWALVAALVGGSVISTAGVLIFRPQAFAWPTLGGLRRVASFSWQVVASRICWYIYASADYTVAGRLLGPTLLGHYTMGRTLASAPLEKLTSLVASVTPAFFATVQSDQAALRRYLLLITEALALVTLPATIGLALVAPDFVAVVLGEKWALAVLPLQLLAIYSAIQSVVLVVPQLLIVTGQTRFAMWINVLMAIVLPIGFVIGSRWGAPGIAGVWIVLYPLLSLPLFHRVFSTIGMRFGDYATSLWPALSSVVCMAVVLQSATWLLDLDGTSLLTLSAKILFGAVAYIAAIWFLHRDRIGQARLVLSYLRK